MVYSNPAMQQMFGMRSNKNREFAELFLHGAIRRGVTLFFSVGAILIARSALQTLIARKTARPIPLPSPQDIDKPSVGALAGLSVPVGWLVIYYAAMFASPVLAFRWYFLPPWPIFCAVAALGEPACERDLVDRTAARTISENSRLSVLAIACVLAFSLLRMNASAAQHRSTAI